ncbi:mitochondrial ribosomal protein S18B [Ptiloglossa arizonensis]|uniref:mitochondrial ribosomal protein S18B n=1 Tax=Ptiloglossa arizonensis TaxID=3350558 RepID=UPI003F9F0729
MSLILNGFQLSGLIFRANLITKVKPVKFVNSSYAQVHTIQENDNRKTIKKIPFTKDRKEIISVETSIKYMKSNAYKQTYGNDPVWKFYKRNFKGQIPPRITRKTCIRNFEISTGNPCPICKDEYLVLDYLNIDLLNQFISKNNGSIISYEKTGICQKAYNDLLVAVYKAKEYGLITFDVPFRYYDYSEWQSS